MYIFSACKSSTLNKCAFNVHNFYEFAIFLSCFTFKGDFSIHQSGYISDIFFFYDEDFCTFCWTHIPIFNHLLFSLFVPVLHQLALIPSVSSARCCLFIPLPHPILFLFPSKQVTYSYSRPILLFSLRVCVFILHTEYQYPHSTTAK